MGSSGREELRGLNLAVVAPPGFSSLITDVPTDVTHVSSMSDVPVAILANYLVFISDAQRAILCNMCTHASTEGPAPAPVVP